MGRKRKLLKRGDSTAFYIPLDATDDEINWINTQIYLNKSLFSLIRKEIHGFIQNAQYIETNSSLKFLISKLVEEKLNQPTKLPSVKNTIASSELLTKTMLELSLD